MKMDKTGGGDMEISGDGGEGDEQFSWAEQCRVNLDNTEEELTRTLTILTNIHRVRQAFKPELSKSQTTDLDKCVAAVLRNMCNSASLYADVTKEYEEALVAGAEEIA